MKRIKDENEDEAVPNEESEEMQSHAERLREELNRARIREAQLRNEVATLREAFTFLQDALIQFQADSNSAGDGQEVSIDITQVVQAQLVQEISAFISRILLEAQSDM